MSKNSNLHGAKKLKDDEFYTYLPDIENEIKHYKKYFKGATILLNCDDPEWSNFWTHFSLKFNDYGLKKLIATHHKPKDVQYTINIKEGHWVIDSPMKNEKAYKLEMTSHDKEPKKSFLKGDGDFRSNEMIDILKDVDIVITNPPFSLFREYIGQLIEYNKKFLIIGPLMNITMKSIFPLIHENKVWYGINKVKAFKHANGLERTFGNVGWYTNLENKRRNEELDLYNTPFDASKYPKYDNYDAINVNKIKDIPSNYYEKMGVPISFLEHHNPKQFKLLAISQTNSKSTLEKDKLRFIGNVLVNGKVMFKRLIIQRIRKESK